MSNRRTPDSRQFFSRASNWSLASLSRMGRVRSVVETEWSMTAKVRSGRRTLRPSVRSPESLGRGAFVNEVAVNVDDRGLAGLFVDDVRVPDFLIERFRSHGVSIRILALLLGEANGRSGGKVDSRQMKVEVQRKTTI